MERGVGGCVMEIFDLANQLDLQSVAFLDFVEATKRAASARWSVFADLVEAWKKTLDPAIWLIGSVAALVPGSFAIYKWWNYRNSRLPQRLTDLLVRDEKRLREEARLALLQAVNTPSAARESVTPPLFTVPTLKKTIRNLNWSGWMNPFPFATAEQELELALVEIEQRLAFCDKSRDNCKKQEALAYIVKGALAVARAGQTGTSPENADRYNRKALNDFSRALEIDPDDLEAIEYLAHQQRVLRQDLPAIISYQRLIMLTQNGNDTLKLITARAYRHTGEILETQFDQTGIGLRLTNARQNLDMAYAAIPSFARGQLEHAAIREVQARLARKDAATILPKTYYSEARTVYEAILEKDNSNQNAKDGCERTKAALREL